MGKTHTDPARLERMGLGVQNYLPTSQCLEAFLQLFLQLPEVQLGSSASKLLPPLSSCMVLSFSTATVFMLNLSGRIFVEFVMILFFRIIDELS